MNYNPNFQGRPRGGFNIGPGRLSPFIKLMLLVNFVFFILQQAIPEMTPLLGLSPYRFFTELPNLLFQPITYMFLHGSFGHIFFNMFALWMFGTEIEHTWGSKSFGKFYILAGLAGALLTLVVQSGSAVPMIGASAAVYGILVAYWVMFPNRRLYIYFVVPVKVKWAIPAFMLLGFLFGGANVAHLAHLGGALFGLMYMKTDWRFLYWKNKAKQFKYKKKSAKLEKNRQKADELMNRVDDILDRINEVGLENLTDEEKKILKDASTNLSKEDK